MTYRTDEQRKKRDEIYDLLIGELSVELKPPSEVELETGIKMPSWFKPQGVTLSEVNMIAQRKRR